MKRLRSVETLGSTSAINSDKTGTLTLNQMTAVQMAVVGRRYAITGEGYSTDGTDQRTSAVSPTSPLDQLLLPMALCADAEVKDGALVGDPTEGALVVLAAKGGVDPTLTREKYPRVATLPFDAAYKMMATFHRMKDADGQGGHPLLCQGSARPAAGARLDRPTAPMAQNIPVDDRSATRTWPRTSDYGATGPARHGHGAARFRSGYVRPECGPAATDRRPRAAGAGRHRRSAAAEARDAIAEAHAAGIQVRMITGDHAVTAEAIAAQLGIRGRAITGAEFLAMSDEEAERQIDDIGVIARVAPEHKVHLVDILRAQWPRHRHDRRRC